MKDEILTLVALQDVDQASSSLRAEMAALPARLAAFEAKLGEQRTAVAATEKLIKDEELKRRCMENDAKSAAEKAARLREQSSVVKTNEQFHALQSEIGFAESEVARIEDLELESMERADGFTITLARQRQALADQVKVVELEKEAADKVRLEQERKMAAFDADRSRLRALVAERLLSEYDRILSGRGTALARAERTTCTGCRMALRPQLWNQVRAGELVPCESCGRLLYFDADRAPVPELEPQPARHRKTKVAAQA